jgi:hypothetical protein
MKKIAQVYQILMINFPVGRNIEGYFFFIGKEIRTSSWKIFVFEITSLYMNK